VHVDGETTIKSTKTGEEYTVTLTGRNLETLRRALGTPGAADTYVIGGGTSPIDPGTITDRFTAVRGAAHVRGVTMTGLRHYWATSMLQAGVPMHTVAKVGRWSSTRMLEQVYGHSTAAGEDLAKAVELV
jgi:integrase